MITFNNIVERFEIFAENHFFIKTFSFGSPDDVDLSKFTSFPLMHLVYTGATYAAGTKTYNLEVYILDAPADKDGKTIRQKEVVSDAEQCAEDIIADIKNGGNIFLFAQDYEVVNATTTPLEEETKNVLSGVLLDLSVAIPYEWDACNAPIDGVTPEGGDEISYARRGILRMVTQNGATDVLSVRTIKVSNGTLTDEGDGVVSLDTAGAESLDELTDVTITSLTPSQFLQYNGISGFWENETLYLATLADTKGTPTEGQLLKYTGGFWQPADIGLNDLDGVTITSPITGNVLKYDSNLGWYNTNIPAPSPPPSTTDQLPEGTTNLYYTEARVSANTDVAANTAKVGITAQQAADILNNNAKVSLIAGGTTGQALVKTSGTDYDVEWADISIDVQYHNRYATEAETLRAGATATTELYYSAQADGDGLAESASSDTPAAGYDIRRKLYYSEAGFADPDTGTWTQFTAIADNTTFANAKAALLAYLKERTGGTVPISLKMTWEEVAQAPSFTGLLNESYGSGAAAAYSVRRLNGLYTGAAIQVERSSDNTYQDIGFDVDGNLDESALTTFCTGTVCKVRTWYDQSVTGGTGSGNDAVQTTHANQPTIYTGGAIVKEDGRATVFFDGTQTNGNFLDATGFGTGAARAVYTVSRFTQNAGGGDSSYHSVYMFQESASTSGDFLQLYTPNASDGITGNFPTNALDLSSSAVTDVKRLITLNKSSSASALHVDGNSQGTGTGTQTLEDQLRIGAFQTFGYAVMHLSELLVYNSDKSTDRTQIESNIGDYFTQNTPLLDTYTGAAAAYSLRLLDSTYTGALVEVYNGSSYADIGANVFGELDTVALAAHCGSNDGFVSVWYDQSGNSNDATQTATGAMPKIYDGTTGVVTENGKPAVDFDGTSHYFTFSITHYFDALYSVFMVRQSSDATSVTLSSANLNSLWVDISNVSTNTTLSANFATSTSDFSIFYKNGAQAFSATTTRTQYAAAMYDGSQILLSILGNGSNASIGASTSMYIGRYYSTGFEYEGKIQEFIIYQSATENQSSNRTGIEDNINTFYSIY